MQFGVFDHMDRAAVPLDRFYADRLRLVEAYDRAGFYGYHVAEHHATPLGVAPSPGVWLAAVGSTPSVCDSGRRAPAAVVSSAETAGRDPCSTS